MSERPTVSVVVPCYNAERTIGETLESVFVQEGVDLEVVVVDDGSGDGSAEFVRARFPRAHLVRTANQGAGAARNLGTSLGSAPLVQYVDADDLLERGKLVTQARALASSGADVAYGAWARFRLAADGSRIVEAPVQRVLGPQPDLELFAGFWCPPAAYLFRRTIVDAVGGFLVDLPVIQDARFALDCALQGGRFVLCEGTMAYYRVHTNGSLSTSNRGAFLADCLRNAEGVLAWWRERALLTDERRLGVADVCHTVARGAVDVAPETFERACSVLADVWPSYAPAEPWRLGFAARCLGYRRAVRLAGAVQRWTGHTRAASVS